MAVLGVQVRGDRGDAGIQMAIVFPAVILATIAVVQAAMWFYARNLALTAAREGVSAGRLYQAAPDDGAARARETLRRLAGDSLRHPRVAVSGTAAQIQITVTGSAPCLLPGIPDLYISQTATGTRERWTTPGG